MRTIFHTQAKIMEDYFGESDSQYIIHCGKTNSGKTYTAIQSLIKSVNGVYLAPLRLLAWEVREKITQSGCLCSLRTGEEQVIVPNAGLSSETIEMFDANRRYDVVVVDECFMIGDKDRGKAWTRAILKARANEIHLICNEESLSIIQELLNTANRKYEVKKYEMLSRFSFFSKPFSFHKNMPPKGVFVAFSRINVLIYKKRFENMGRSVSVLYGNLPPEAKKIQIERFINGDTEIMVCTDVIGMGINVPCDYLVFLDVEKFDGYSMRQLTPIEVRQIAGRVGRYGLCDGSPFVATTSNRNTNFIKTQYKKHQEVNKAILGLDYDMFLNCGEDKIHKRIAKFSSSSVIPSNLKGILNKEDISKYMDIANVIRDDFDVSVSWIFLNAPIKKNNRNYFSEVVRYYKLKNKLLKPTNYSIGDMQSLEDTISRYELYLNLCRNLIHCQKEKGQVEKEKDELVEKLTNMLMDKKMSSKRKCRLCSEMLDITYPYPYCQNCYEEKFCSSW